MMASRTGTTNASREVVEVLTRAFGRAARFGDTSVGTQHVLFVLLKGESAAADLLAPRAGVRGSLQGVTAAKTNVQWVSADDNASTESPAVTALLREAEWAAGKTAKGRDKPDRPPQATRALAAAVGRMLVSAHELGVDWAHETHLLMGLMHDPGNRACESLLEVRLDREELIARLNVHPTARQNGTPNASSVDGLRNLGVLNHRGKRWGGLAKALTSGGFGSPVMPTVRLEARRQAVRLGHSQVTMVHLLLAMLVLDDQLAATGHRLRDEFAQVNTGAELLRARGVTLSAAISAAAELNPPDQDQDRVVSPTLTMDSGAEQALTRTRLLSNERKSPSAGTTHLLTALLADPRNPCDALLAAIGVDTGELRQTLAEI